MNEALSAFSGRRVWLSGHTGFKGGWLAAWLHDLGAEVHGFALPPDSRPNLFEALGVDTFTRSELADLRDADAVAASVARADPDIVFHLAAQPLVRRSYAEPTLTMATNALGTVHVLDAVRRRGRPCAVVVATTDKVYADRPAPAGYVESDRLGGHDP